MSNKVINTTRTIDMNLLDKDTNNTYESIAIISKRANQIAIKDRDELQSKLSEFTSVIDNLEEVFENREQIEISRYYERLPKPSVKALDEFLQDKTYYRNPDKEESEM